MGDDGEREPANGQLCSSMQNSSFGWPDGPPENQATSAVG